MGRPGVGVYLRDVEKVAMAVAAAGLILEGPEETPLAQLMENIKTGKIRSDLPNVRFLSIIIEGKCPIGVLPKVLQGLSSPVYLSVLVKKPLLSLLFFLYIPIIVQELLLYH